MDRVIHSCTCQELQEALIRPYHLSFITLNAFQSIVVTIELDTGEHTKAEVVPLEGYSEESYDHVLANVQQMSKRLAGKSLRDARSFVIESMPNQPFSMSPFLTAIDLFTWESINPEELVTLPSLTPLNSENAEGMKTQLMNRKVGDVFKIKLSGNAKIDTSAFKMLSSIDLGDTELRLDANQAYSVTEAFIFLNNISELPCFKNVLYLEQALPINDWDGQEQLIRNFGNFKFMIDEGILSKGDIGRAADIGAAFVKLKLFKEGGIKELIERAEYANKLGLKTIVGNGVATRLSNLVELSVYYKYRQLFYGVHEANGYLKVRS